MKLAHAIAGLAQTVLDLAQQQARTGTAMSDIAREQRITNLIVRAQISTDPQEKARLMGEATRRMDQPHRRSPHDPL